jgi:hypothetical protein
VGVTRFTSGVRDLTASTQPQPRSECVLPSGTLFIEYVNLGFSGEMGSDIPSSLRLGTRSKEVPWVSPVSPAAYAT